MALGICSSGNKDADGEIGLRPSSDSIIKLQIPRSQCVDAEDAFLLIKGERMTQCVLRVKLGSTLDASTTGKYRHTLCPYSSVLS